MTTQSKMTAEDLARKVANAHGLDYEKTDPLRWREAARAAADALGVELAPEREELEPCPACGGGAEICNPGDIVMCSDLIACGVQGPDHDPSGSKWNRMCRRLRTYRPPPELEKGHPRPWRAVKSIEGGSWRVVDCYGNAILSPRGETSAIRALVAAYNAAGPSKE